VEALRRDERSDFAYSIPNLGRFGQRLPATQHDWDVFRLVRPMPALRELNLPESVRRLASEQRGLILVTGPTGCGKTRPRGHGRPHQPDPECHIVTIEDPIEVLHQDELSRSASERWVSTQRASS